MDVIISPTLPTPDCNEYKLSGVIELKLSHLVVVPGIMKRSLIN